MAVVMQMQAKELSSVSDTIIIPELNFQFDTSELAKIRDAFPSDSKEYAEVKEAMEEAKKAMREAKTEMGKSMKDFSSNFKAEFGKVFGDQQRNNPVRTEKKNFDNIAKIEILHEHGNIIIIDSPSKQVGVEVQYMNPEDKLKESTFLVNNKLLSIKTNGTGKSPSGANINYIVRVPKDMELAVNLKYGNVKMDSPVGNFTLDLSYGNLMANSIVGKANIRIQYSDMKVDEAGDVSLLAMYSNIKMNKAKRVDLTGNYTDFGIGDLLIFQMPKTFSYGDIRIGKLTTYEGRSIYTDIVINDLLDNIKANTSYGDITIKNLSSKARNVLIDGDYSDISIGLEPNAVASIDASLTYGDFEVAKKYSVKYTESKEDDTFTVRKGQIGNGTVKTNIKVSNNFADISIK